MPKKRQIRGQARTLRVSTLEKTGELLANQVATLVVVRGAEADLGRRMQCSHPVIIGRDERVEFPLSDGSISRAHCTVERDETGAYWLVDLGSTNGTSLNGDKVNGKVPLNPGDKVFLGASVLRFDLADSLDLKYQDELDKMVNTDALTGMSAKRQYDAIFEREASKAQASNSYLTVIVMDMDGLKRINDTHGHQFGSFAIAETSRVIQSVLGDHGHLSRFGGDEFVGCFPDIDHAEICQLAELVRLQVEQHNFTMDGVEIHPTLSVGVATYPRDVDDADELFVAADQAMYQAKRTGKNKIATAGKTKA